MGRGSTIDPRRPLESVTLKVTSSMSSVVGVPEIVPSVARVRPSGRVPEATAHVYGAVPPVAASFAVYSASTVPSGSDVDVTDSGVTPSVVEVVSAASTQSALNCQYAVLPRAAVPWYSGPPGKVV